MSISEEKQVRSGPAAHPARQAAAEAEAQAALRAVVVGLEELRSRLEEVHAHLSPPPGEEARLVDEEGMSVSAELRAAIECVLRDSLDPAIRDLAAAASYRPQGGVS
jgi:hypothetical protein